MAYTRNRPLATDFLSSSQPILLNNTNASDDSFGVDHYAFSDTTANKGRHKIVQQTTIAGAGPLNRTRSGAGAVTANFPSNVSGINQVFAAQYTPDYSTATADTQFFALTGKGGLSQLTGNSSETDGWQWIGGVLIQWGQVITAATSGTVTFKDRGPSSQGITFPNACFVVQTTVTYSNTGATGFVFSVRNNSGSGTPSKTQFEWTRGGSAGSGSLNGFYWIAIGN